MAASTRYGLARSYQLSGALGAVVSDDGAPGRSVSIASSGDWLRPVIADPAGTGASTSDPYELFTRASSQLTTGAGGGTWTIRLHTDGRTKITWTGVGTGTINSGSFLSLLGFNGAVGPLASGASAYSYYPALGLLLWPYLQDDTGWQPEIDSARTEDSRGQLIVYRSSAIRHRRRFRAYWVPRDFLSNSADEYFSPCWSTDIVKSGPTSVTAPDYNATFSVTGWMDFVFSMSGEIECGFCEDVTTFLDGGYALGVSLGSSMFDPERIVPTATATTYAPRRDVFVELLKRREIAS